MKIVARSIVPVQSPYMHLGYIAATEPTAAQTTLGSIFFFSAAFSLIAAVLVYGLKLKSKIWRLAIIIPLLIGFASVYISTTPLARIKPKYLDPEAITQARARNLWLLINGTHEHDKYYPIRINELKKLGHFGDEYFQDAWYRSLRIKKTGEDTYSVVSAGQDGEFGSKDDLIYPRNYNVGRSK